MACYFSSDGSISCTFQPHKEQRIHSKRRIGNSMGITTGEDHLPRVGIVERTTRVGVLGHLDELERLMREYVAWVSEGVGEDAGLTRQLALSSFLEWVRQRKRESVAAATIADDDGPVEPQRRGRPTRIADIGD